MQELGPIDPEELRNAAAKAAKKAAGPDGWAAKELVRAPTAWWKGVARILEAAGGGDPCPSAP